MRKVVSIILVLFMIGATVVPQKNMPVYAYSEPAASAPASSTTQDQINYPTTTDTDFNNQDVKLVGEVNSLRTENTKTFQREDGNFVVAIYNDAVHYMKDGEYKDIDNSLNYDTNNDEYSNKANKFSIKFPKNINENKKIKLSLDEYSVDWTILSAEKSTIVVDDTDMKANNIKELTDVCKKVFYENILDNVNLEYIVNGGNIKENIIINKYIKKFSMTFQYELKNLSLIQDGNDIKFVNSTGGEIFNFNQMFAIDYEENTNYNINVNVVEIKKDVYHITVSADDGWMKNAKYPVTIDPSIISSTQTMTYYDTYVSEDNQETSYFKSTFMILSSTSSSSKYEGLMYFYLPDAVMDKEITYATYTLSASSKTYGRTIGLYKNDNGFSEDTVGWYSRPSTSTTMTDYHIVDQNNKYVFNITKTVREWQTTGSTLTTGFTIRDKSYYGAYNSVKTKEYTTDPTKMPVIEIGYIDPAGLKDYWTYNSQQVGEYSTGYVSDFTGLLTVIRNDLNFETERQTLSLNFGYNILDRGTNVGYGSGWNIVYNSYVKYDSYLQQYYTQDYTGNKVYYHPVTADGRINPSAPEVDYCYLAEDGSRNILVRQFAYGYFGGQYILTNDNIKQIYNTSGYLTSIRNEETNQSIYITRDGTYPDKVTKIRDMSNNEINITYNSYGIYTAILSVYQDSSNSHDLEKLYYYYESVPDYSTYSPYLVKHYKDYDNNNSLSLDDYIYYHYDNNGRMEQFYMNGQDNVEYTYNTTTNKVTTIKSSYNSAYFSELDYTYSLRETTITNQTDDFVIYKFDDFGHTVNILDSDGNTQFYKYLNLFSAQDTNEVNYLILDGEPNYKLNNMLVSQSDPQSNIFNPVINHNFEHESLQTMVGWQFHNNIGTQTDYHGITNDGTTNLTQTLIGQHAAYIYSDASDNGEYIQEVVLDQGAYTLTGYVKNDTNSSSVFMDISGADYGGAIEYIQATGEWTKVEITFGLYSDNQTLTIELGNHSNGLAYFDNISIVEGFNDTRINVMDNPSFEKLTGSYLYGWSFSDPYYVSRAPISGLNDDLFDSMLGDYAVKIVGSPTTNRWATSGIFDFLDTDILEQQGTLIIGAWAYYDGAPITTTIGDYADGNDRYFRIRVVFTESTNVVQTSYVNFDSSIEGWQYLYNQIELPEDNFDLVNVYFDYKGLGDAYFDGLQVYYENSYTHYEYDEYGNLINIKTSSGDLTEYNYDEEKDYPSKPTDIVLPDETKVELSEDSNNMIYEVTYNNVTSTPTYNSYGQVTHMTIGDASHYFTTSTTYTHLSQYTLTKTDEFNNTTNYYNDTLNGLLEAIENAKGQDTHYIYDNEGKLIKVVSVDDYENYSVGEEDALVEYMYDTKDRLYKIILDDDYYYEISYDSQGRMDQISVNTTPLMSYSYEMDGTYYTDRLSEQTYGNGDVLKFTYNDKDQVDTVQFKESGGSFVTRFSYEYDASGRIAVYNTYENSLIIGSEYYSYDSKGNLVQAVDNEGNIIKYIYDASGNLTSLYYKIDGNSSTTNYNYNECFAYNGDACIQTSSLYDKTEYTTKAFDDITKDYHYETSALYRLQYIYLTGDSFNAKQNFIYSGNTTRINQITYEINGSGVDYKYSYSYDDLGNITHEYYYEGTSLKLYRNYEYDVLNQLVVEDSRDYNYSSSTLNDTNFTKFYYYDSRGNRTDVKTFHYGENDYVDATPPSFSSINYGFPLLEMYYNSGYDYQDIYNLNVGQSPSISFTYYDEISHNLVYGITTSIISSNLDIYNDGYYYSYYEATDGYDYDLVFKIVYKVGNPVGGPNTPEEHFHYNYSSNWEDQLLGYEAWTYDGSGSHTGTTTIQEYTYDNQGNPTNITNFVYDSTTYDHAILSWSGRDLSQIDIYNSSQVNMYRIEYTYNDQGYRTNQTISYYNGSIWGNISVIDYKLVDDRVIYESGQEFNTSYQEINNYVIMYTYDYDGKLISFNYEDDTHSSADYFYLRNQQGDITHILDASGNTVVTYKYDAYGNIISQNPEPGYQHIANHNAYTYRGYRYDSATNLYYLNSRYYNPVVGRFINADAMIGETGAILETNMYSYCFNNPIMNIDANGYMPNWLKITIAVAIVAVAVVATVATAGTAASVIFAGAALGGGSGLVAGGVSGGFNSVVNGGSFMDGFADGALTGSITGAISGALAASPAGLGLQIAGNAGLSGVSYTVQNIDSFSVEGLLLNMGVGAAAGYVGGSGWLSKGSLLPIDIALNGTGNTLAILGSSGFATFGASILKATVVGSTASGIEIVKTLIDKIRGGE